MNVWDRKICARQKYQESFLRKVVSEVGPKGKLGISPIEKRNRRILYKAQGKKQHGILINMSKNLNKGWRELGKVGTKTTEFLPRDFDLCPQRNGKLLKCFEQALHDQMTV